MSSSMVASVVVYVAVFIVGGLCAVLCVTPYNVASVKYGESPHHKTAAWGRIFSLLSTQNQREET